MEKTNALTFLAFILVVGGFAYLRWAARRIDEHRAKQPPRS
jgi:hypothetical protein